METPPAHAVPPEWWKNGGVAIRFIETNPKQQGSKAWTRYEQYKMTTTVAAAVAMGATREDLQSDFRRHLLILTAHETAVDDDSDMDTHTAGGKRDARQSEFASPEGSKQRPTRRQRPASDGGEGEQLHVKAEPRDIPAAVATSSDERLLAAMQAMIKAEAQETRAVFKNALNDIRQSIDDVKRDVANERSDRQNEVRSLADRLGLVEKRLSEPRPRGNGNTTTTDDDKHTLVVGGFGTVPKEVALDTVTKALDEVAGFVEAYATSEVPSVVFARFDTEQAVTTFLRTQKNVEEFNGLRANRSRPPEERKAQRMLNKIKRAVCEETPCEGKDVRVNRNSHRVYHVRDAVATEVARVRNEQIEWAAAVTANIKERCATLLDE